MPLMAMSDSIMHTRRYPVEPANLGWLGSFPALAQIQKRIVSLEDWRKELLAAVRTGQADASHATDLISSIDSKLSYAKDVVARYQAGMATGKDLKKALDRTIGLNGLGAQMVDVSGVSYPYTAPGGWTLVVVNGAAQYRNKKGVFKKPIDVGVDAGVAPHAESVNKWVAGGLSVTSIAVLAVGGLLVYKWYRKRKGA